MKYLNFILTVIAMSLVVIALRFFLLESSLEELNANNQLLASAQHSLINANQRLVDELSALKKQIAEINATVLKR